MCEIDNLSRIIAQRVFVEPLDEQLPLDGAQNLTTVDEFLRTEVLFKPSVYGDEHADAPAPLTLKNDI